MNVRLAGMVVGITSCVLSVGRESCRSLGLGLGLVRVVMGLGVSVMLDCEMSKVDRDYQPFRLDLKRLLWKHNAELFVDEMYGEISVRFCDGEVRRIGERVGSWDAE